MNKGNENSEVRKAAQQADVDQIEKNLDDKNDTGTPENLNDQEKTPFIDDSLRTDK